MRRHPLFLDIDFASLEARIYGDLDRPDVVVLDGMTAYTDLTGTKPRMIIVDDVSDLGFIPVVQREETLLKPTMKQIAGTRAPTTKGDKRRNRKFRWS